MPNLPRVSTILSVLYPNSLDFIKDEHLERGTRLHKSMEDWGDAILNERPIPYVFQECVPLIQCMQDNGMELFECEQQHEHKTYGYTGRPDAIIQWNGKFWIVDYKFSESITEQNLMQMEAYSEMMKMGVVLLQVDKNGTVKIKKRKPRPDLWAAFCSGLNVYKFINRNGSK